MVGGAGSGQTTVLLEKLKTITGEVLYVTHSAYLAEHAKELFYAHDFQREEQSVDFLSYREYLETWKTPEGREAHWRDFSGWFARIRQNYKWIDAVPLADGRGNRRDRARSERKSHHRHLHPTHRERAESWEQSLFFLRFYGAWQAPLVDGCFQGGT